MTIYIVRFTHGGDQEPFVFLFEEETEATQFRDHVRDLYEVPNIELFTSGLDTYQTALDTLVESVGPSPE